MRNRWFHACLVLSLIAGFHFKSVQADAGNLHTYIPIGSDYRANTLQRFAQAAAQHDANRVVDILVIPITFATDPFNISNGERQQNLTLADNRRGLVESACNESNPANTIWLSPSYPPARARLNCPERTSSHACPTAIAPAAHAFAMIVIGPPNPYASHRSIACRCAR